MRAIDADVLIEKYGEWYTEDGTEEGFIGTIKNLIDEQPTIDLPHWIPVTERLPENDDWQIVTICDESADRPYIYSDFGWYLDVAKCWIVDADQQRDIIAWMPLPEPYKGDET